MLAAYVGLAKHADLVPSQVKVTAFEELGGEGAGGDGVELLAFPAGLRFERLPASAVGDAVALAVADDPEELQLPQSSPALKCMSEVRELLLFVCCHGARDARCGSLGPPLAAALLRGVRERGLQEQVRVLKTSHVGGHKHAGNVLVHGAVHPCDGDWFGGLSAPAAGAFLDALLGMEVGADGGAEDPVLRRWWRGRLGLSKAEQRALHAAGGAVEAADPRWLSEGEEEEGDEEGEEFEAAVPWGEEGGAAEGATAARRGKPGGGRRLPWSPF
eukprot:scaffold8.g1394.t1